MSERLTRRELKRDQFLEGVLSAVTWARQHLLVAVGAAVVLIAAITLAVRIGGSAAGTVRVDEKAERALSEARTQFMKSGPTAGLPALEAVRDAHSGSRAAREATLLVANTYFENGDYAKAQATYEDFLKKPLYDDLMIDGAKLGIAACQEEQANLAGATAKYQEIWKSGKTPGTRLQGALGAARTEEAAGNVDRAIQLYQEAIDAYPKAPEAEEARFEKMRLEGLKKQG
jgi:tetratricopeptide (TPR) repeat protein